MVPSRVVDGVTHEELNQVIDWIDRYETVKGKYDISSQVTDKTVKAMIRFNDTASIVLETDVGLINGTIYIKDAKDEFVIGASNIIRRLFNRDKTALEYLVDTIKHKLK